MKHLLVVLTCLIWVVFGTDARYLPYGSPPSPAIAYQHSKSEVGPYGKGVSNGEASAHNELGGLAEAHQVSESVAGFGGSAYSGGKAVASSGPSYSALRYQRSLTGFGSPKVPIHFPPVPYNSPAVSKQTSEFQVGHGGTGIGQGQSEATNNGFGGAFSKQKTTGVGGDNAVVVVSGTSSAVVNTPRVYRRYAPYYALPHVHPFYAYNNNPAVSHQQTNGHVGFGGTGIGQGDSSAYNNGYGGAYSSQNTNMYGGPGSTIVASGSSKAVVNGGPRYYRREADADKKGPNVVVPNLTLDDFVNSAIEKAAKDKNALFVSSSVSASNADAN